MSVVARFGSSGASQLIEVACLASDAVGNALCIRDEHDGEGRWQVETANPLDRAKMAAIGILTAKDGSTTGIMQVEGNIESLYSVLVPGKVLYVGLDGRLTHEMPVPDPGELVYVQRMAVASSHDVVWLNGGAAHVIGRRG